MNHARVPAVRILLLNGTGACGAGAPGPVAPDEKRRRSRTGNKR